MSTGIQRSSLRTFGQVVSAALVAALFTVSPMAPQAPAEAAGDLEVMFLKTKLDPELVTGVFLLPLKIFG